MIDRSITQVTRHVCREEFHTADLRLSPQRDLLARTAHGCSLGEPGFREGSRQSVLRMACVPEPFVNIIRFMLNVHFPPPPGESGTLVRACRQRVATWPASIKMGLQASDQLPWWTLLHTCRRNSVREESMACCVTPQGAWAWLPPTWCLCLSFRSNTAECGAGLPASEGSWRPPGDTGMPCQMAVPLLGAMNTLKHVAHFLKQS